MRGGDGGLFLIKGGYSVMISPSKGYVKVKKLGSANIEAHCIVPINNMHLL